MRIAILGDVALIGKYSIENNKIEKIKKRFSQIKPILDTSDYIIANLETPFTTINETKEAKTLALKTNPMNIEILKYLGVTAVSLANNHFFDYGMAGAKECLNILENAQIGYFGINNKKYVLKNEDTIVSLGGFCCHTTNGWYYDDIDFKSEYKLNTLNEKSIFNFLEECRFLGTYPIIIPHWGEENTHYPNKIHIGISDLIMNKYEATIVGHHPHVIQGIKKYLNGMTFFSVGNFCFDDCISSTGSNVSVRQIKENLEGILVILELQNNKLVNYEIIPYQDTEEEIKINKQISEIIKKVYSAKLNNVVDWLIYDKLREYEYKEAFKKRLGKRDIKWLLGHLNIKSTRTVFQRRKNKECFINSTKNIMKNIYNKKYEEHRKTIVYIGNFDRPNKSAAGKRVYGIAKILEKLGYNVYLIGKESSFDDKVAYSSNIFYYSFPKYNIIKSNSYIKWFNKFLLERNIKPELIIRYGSPSLAYFDFLLSRWCKKNKIPIIVDVVDWLSSDGNNLIFNLIKTIDTFLEKVIFNRFCDGIIVISNYLFEYYKKYQNNIIIIPPLVTETVNNVTKNEVIKFIYAGSPFRKGNYIKNVHKIKDRLDLCVAAISEVSKKYRVQLDIFGLTKEEFLQAFPKYKNEARNSSIIFHGMKKMEEVQKYISSCDYSILLREVNRATMAGFPTKIVESLSCGTPVITTDTSDLKKYIRNGENGYIVSIESKSILINEIEKICRNNLENITKMKKKCYEKEEFLYKNYLSVVKEFINRSLLESDYK